MTVGTVPDDHTGPAVGATDVRAALAQLSPEYRQVVMEMYFRRRSVDQTAQLLGIPAATVIARSYYGLHQLRETIRLSGIDVSRLG
jgi:RNA polymerase sigma-70 factor (ECF subfamily)